MKKKRALIPFSLAVLSGLMGVIATLLLLSQGASARPMLQASLSLSKNESADPVRVGSQLIYTLTYQNTSTETVTGVAITDTLDPNLIYVDAWPAPDGGLPDAPFWSVGTLSASVSGQIVVTTTVANELPNGIALTNTATIDSNETQPTSVQINTTVAAPVLELTKSDQPDPVTAGAPLTYTLTYSNTGDITATEVVITDVLDGNVTFVSAAPSPAGGQGSTRFWNIGDLPISTAGQIVIHVSVHSGLGTDITLTNTATIDSQENPPASITENTAVISHGTAVSLTLAPASHAISAGQSVPYTLTAHDAYGNGWDVTASGTYTISPAAGGSWTDNVYTSQRAGTWIVTSTFQSLVATATLTVNPGALDHITICTDANGESPAGDHTMTTDDTWTLYAAGFDAYDNFIANQSVTWGHTETLDPVSGSGPSYTFAPSTANTSGTITANDGSGHSDATGVITVNVGTLHHIMIRTGPNNGGEEAESRAMTTDDTWTLYAAGYDADGNFIADQVVTWGRTGTLDPVSGSGTSYTFAPWTANTSGTITANDGHGHTDQTGLIAVVAGALHHIQICTNSNGQNPAGDHTMTTDDTWVLYAAGYDADNNFIANETVTWTVSGGIGTVAPTTGASTTLDATAPGSGSVHADHATAIDDDTGTITVSVGAPSTIMIRTGPNNSGEEAGSHAMTTDETWTLYAAGYDADGNFIADLQVTWSVVGAIGTVAPGTGISTTFDATTPGTGHVHADHTMAADDDTDTITVTVGALHHVELTPASATRTAGTPITYTLTAYDADGNPWDVTASGTYTISPAAGGSWSANTYTAQVAGAWTVTGTVGTAFDTALLTVTHAGAAALSLTPPTTTISAGQSVTYTATATDSFSNTWDATDEADFSISSGAGGSWADNVYTSQWAGAWTVTGTVGTAFDTALLTVTHAGAAALSLTPPTATISAGQSVTYTATATDSFGNGWDATDEADFAISPAAGGSWTDNFYTSQRAGTWTVTGTVGTASDTALLTVVHAALDHVTLTPDGATVAAGNPITYTLTAYDAYANPWDVTASGTYTISPAAGGSWLANTYTAQVAGTWTVTGTYGSRSDTAPLTVEPGELASIVLSPDPATIQSGDSETYTVEGFDAFGNSRGDVTEQTAFSILEPGHGGTWIGNVYTSRNPGNWTAQGLCDGITDTASLTVLGPILHLAKTDQPDPVEAGAYLTYTLTYSNTGNQTATGVVLTDTLDPRLDYVGASPPPSGFRQGNPYWQLPPLEIGGSGRIDLRVRVHTPLPNNTILTNHAIMDCNQTEPVSVTEETTVHSRPVLSLSKRDGPDPVEAGAQLIYTLVYTNTGNEIASGTIITDILDPHVQFVAASPPAQGSGRTRYWTVGDLPPGGPHQILVTVTVASPLPNGTLLTNTAQIDSDQTPPLSTTEQTIVHSSPILAIAKTDIPDPVTADEILYYTLVITNSGNENATSVSVLETYDPNVTFVNAEPDPYPGTNNLWRFGTLEAGDSRSIEVTVRVATPLPVGTRLTNTATLDCDQTPPISVTEITQVQSQSVLKVTQVDNPDPVDAGEELVYAITYRNTGTANANHVIITDTYDSRVTYLSATPPPSVGNNVWRILSLPVGESGTIIVRVKVHSPLPNGSILVNTVTIDSDETDPTSYITTTQVRSAPALAFQVSDQPDPVEAGAPLTYTLRYTNTGNADATGVIITATLDSDVRFNSATPEPSGGSNRTWYWQVDEIPGEGGVGQIIIHTDVVLPLSNGTRLDFTAQMTDAEGDSLQDTEQTTVHSAPVISFSKSDGVTTVYAGQRLTYTLTYTNSGNENATHLRITDTLPSHVQYINCSIISGSCERISPSQVLFHIPRLNAQAHAQARLMVRVNDPLAAGARLIVNRATMGALLFPLHIEVEDVDEIGTRPDLTISGVHAPSLFSPGKWMTYTLTYGNEGRMHAEDVVITTVLPISTTYAGYGWTSSDGHLYTYSAGNLSAGVTGQIAVFTVRYTDAEPQQIRSPEFDTPFTITEQAHGGEDADPADNAAPIFIGVPDLVVADFTINPRPLTPNVPVTFTILLKNQGTGIAWNPDNGGPFWVDIFTDTVSSYPFERYGEFFTGAGPIGPGQEWTVVITHTGFTEAEIQAIDNFYAKVDNSHVYPYGLVPESNEMNNCSEPLNPQSGNSTIYLPLIFR